MRFAYLLISLILVLSVTRIMSAQPESSVATKIDEYFTQLAVQNWFNGSVLVAQNSKIILRKAYNISEVRQTGKVTIESKFIIASVSKLLIKASILKLAELKKLNIDDKLSKFIPDFPNGDKITVKNLLEHTSGLPRELTGYKDYDSLKIMKIVELAKKEKLEFEPSSKILYSNIGYSLLHFIISKTAVEGYPRFTIEKIIKPLKMLSTNEYNFVKPLSLLALGVFDDDLGNIQNIDEKVISRMETGNYYSTVDDLFAFIKGIEKKKLLKPPFVEMMHKSNGVLEHAGGRDGYRSWLHYNHKTGLKFIFLSNYSNIPFDSIITDIPKIVYQQPYEIPHRILKIAKEIEPEILQKYVGNYELEVDKKQKFRVSVENGKLFIYDNEHNKTLFYPENETRFFSNPKTADGIEFVINQDGIKFDLVFKEGGIRIIAKRVE